jgi:aminoglycoside/choline kinase family phosphotransferase
VLLEDLGDDLYADALARGQDERTIYGTAVDALALLHAEDAPDRLPPDKPLYSYDETAQLAEIELMTEWFIPMALGRKARDEEGAEHRQLWRDTLKSTRAASSVFVHRDYHSPNLIWLPGRQGMARVGIIDFQDAVAGTRSYDLISLTQDARRDVAPGLGEAMTQHYLAAMKDQGLELDGDAHRAEMAVIAAQRNTKIAGIFARLYKRDGKPRYLAHLPRIWRYLSRDLEHPALGPLKAWYDRTIPIEARGAPVAKGAIA